LTGATGRLVHVRLPWQVRRQGLANGRVGCALRLALRGWSSSGVGFELLQGKLQLRDLRIERFGGATELHPLETRQLQLQLLDEHIARAQLGGEALDL